MHRKKNLQKEQGFETENPILLNPNSNKQQWN